MRVPTSKLVQSLMPLLSLIGADTTNLQTFSIRNRCPTPIPIYINGQDQGYLPSGDSITKTFLKDWSGLIYTSANGGISSGRNSTRAGFYGEVGYYYVVRDPDYFNVGVSITPRVPDKDGFCTVSACDSAGCENSFSSPPYTFPPMSNLPPSPPLHSCHIAKPKYTVTFCPSSALPAGPDAVRIHPNNNTKNCMEVRGGVFKNGTEVQIYDCNETAAQNWIIKRDYPTAIQLAGTNFCLDAGSNPGNHVGMKIWQCFKDLAAQTWSYHTDNSIHLEGTDQCLDLPSGNTNNTNQIQTYACHPRNTNQHWTTNHNLTTFPDPSN